MSEGHIQSCIKTKLTISRSFLMPWVAKRFPEFGSDARIVEAHAYDGSDDIRFVIEHTVQVEKPVGPILLEMPNKGVEDAEFEA